MRLEVQQAIINKAFRRNKIPFNQNADTFDWSGATKVTSKNSGITYDIEITLSLKTNPRLAGQMAACLVKPEGVRMEDLVIAGMIDPRLKGTIDVKGLPPKDKVETDLGKFIKKVSQLAE